MIRLLGKIPRDFCLAYSGGQDSGVALNFLLNGRHKPHVIHFHHGTKHSDDAEWIVKRECERYRREFNIDFELTIGRLEEDTPKGRSKEDFWREKRYDFFRQFNKPVITAHHLDDVLEWWVFSSLNGENKLIPYRVENYPQATPEVYPYDKPQNHYIIRPFLTSDKSSIKKWSARAFNNKSPVFWLDDPSNEDTSFKRNYIRKHMVHHIEQINPGIRTMLRKKIERMNLQGE